VRSVLYFGRMNTNEKLAVSIHEAARLLSVSPRSIQNFLHSKMLPSRKIGRRTVIPVAALERFLRVDHASPERLARAEARESQT
jgi:excisionase family DNA binding protein